MAVADLSVVIRQPAEYVVALWNPLAVRFVTVIVCCRRGR